MKERPHAIITPGLFFQDLIRCTPTSHGDYDLLQKTLKITQQFLDTFQSPKDLEDVGFIIDVMCLLTWEMGPLFTKQCCQDACQILEQCDHNIMKCRSFKSSWILAVRRLCE